MLALNGIAELTALVGQDLGTSDWHVVGQPLIDAFAAATDDFEEIHVNPARGAEAGLGGTIAHGLYTLALGPKFLYEIYSMSGHSLGLNYGFDRVRFLSPVKVGSRVRMTATVTKAEPIDGGVKFSVRQSFEIEGAEKPACVADSLL